MLKSILGLLMTVSFAATANAALEVQINSSVLGTAGGITLEDDGTNDRTILGFGAEVYTPLSENLQVGGVLAYNDQDIPNVDASISLGAMVRYNLTTELRDAVFVGGGIIYNDNGSSDGIDLALQVGKRYALSESITWTPNVTVQIPVSGEGPGGADREGHRIAINLLSFSGFLD